MPFFAEAFVPIIKHEPTQREFRFAYAQFEGFLGAANLNADGSFTDLVTNNVTLQPNPELPSFPGQDGAPVRGTITVINPPGSSSPGARPFGGSSDCPGCDELVAGSLAFTGFGDAPMKFLSPSGVALAQPASAPVQPGAGCDGIVALTTGRIATIGGGLPNFPTTGIGVWNADFTVHAQGAAGAHGFGGRSIARDSSGRFYVARSSVAASSYIFQYDQTGAQTAEWHLGDQIVSIGITPDAAIAYYVQFLTSNVVRAWDLIGNVSLGVFATGAAGAVVRHNGLLCLGTHVFVAWDRPTGVGTVDEFDAAGTLVKPYAMFGTSNFPVTLTPGRANGSSFWCGYYCVDAVTSSGIRIAEFAVDSGVVLNCFDPEDGAFEFDGPFCQIAADA